MKNISRLAFLLVAVATLLVSSCGSKDSDPDPSAQELTIEALSGDWGIDSSSQLGNLTIDGSASTVSIFETGFTITGDLQEYVSAGTFTVNEEGGFENIEVEVSSTLNVSSAPTVSLNSARTQLTVEFETTAARVSGLGNYTLILVKI